MWRSGARSCSRTRRSTSSTRCSTTTTCSRNRSSTAAAPSIVLLQLARGAEKRALFERLKENAAEGIVFKQRAAPYTPGRPSSGGPQRKYKLTKRADVVLLKNAGNAYLMGVHHGANV